MYLWYESSKMCVVYLDDVPQKPITESHWFDRGWTLQELIAPKVVSFFDRNWNLIGTKAKLIAELSQKTRISEDVLSHSAKPSSCSVAQRMSWAAKRVTKRVEDRAYSLMGLFDVYMPMIYGEREKSFLRLQQQIIQKYKDESIFAWSMEDADDNTVTYSGPYAPSPSAYINCPNVVPTLGSQGFSEIQGELSLSAIVQTHTPGTYCAILHCADGTRPGTRIGITVAKMSEAGSNEYVRVMRPDESSLAVFQISGEGAEENIRVPVSPSEPPQPIYYGFWLRTLEPPGHAENQITILSNCPTSQPDFIRQDSQHRHLNTGVARIKPRTSSENSNWSQIRWMKFGFSLEFKPMIWLANDSHSNRLDEPFERAIVSLRNARTQSQEVEEALKEDLLEECTGDPTQKLRYDWPEGRLLITIKGSGLRGFVIPELNLKIQVQLQPLHSPNISTFGGVDHQGLPIKPTLVWVVDITETVGKAGSLSGVTPADESTCCSVCFGWICCCPCYCCMFLCGNENANADLVFLPHTQAKRKSKRAAKEKREYLLGASTRLPLVDTQPQLREATALESGENHGEEMSS